MMIRRRRLLLIQHYHHSSVESIGMILLVSLWSVPFICTVLVTAFTNPSSSSSSLSVSSIHRWMSMSSSKKAFSTTTTKATKLTNLITPPMTMLWQTPDHSIRLRPNPLVLFSSDQSSSSASSSLSSSESTTGNNNNNNTNELCMSVDDALRSRYACTRYQRYGEDDEGRTTMTMMVSNVADETETISGRNGTTTSTSPSPSTSTTSSLTSSTTTTTTTSAVTKTASMSDPVVVQMAFECLDVARRAPSGFNIQPYKIVLVHTPRQKQALSTYCIGRNADRVRDSDCTVVFLADKQCLRTLPQYRTMLRHNNEDRWYRQSNLINDGGNNNNNGQPQQRRRRRRWWRWRLIKLQLLVALFSSGWPYVPAILSQPMSAIMGFAMRVVSWIGRSRLVVPTLSGPETWSQKNTMMVAMSYLLSCTSRGLATTPMEGYLSWGVRKVLNIPRRYTIPLIVATGRPYQYPTSPSLGDSSGVEIPAMTNSTAEDGRGTASGVMEQTITTTTTTTTTISPSLSTGDGKTLPVTTKDDAGMAHGNTRETTTPRFPTDSIIYGDKFGMTMNVDMS